MSPRRKQAHRQSILGWLFSDPWRKLGAIALALVSWEYLDTKVNANLTSTLEIRLPEETTSSDDNYLWIKIDTQDYTLSSDDVMDDNNQPLTGIDIEIKGEKATINRLRGQLRLVYRPTPSALERAKVKGFLDFDIDDLVHANRDLGKDFRSLDSMVTKPATIRLKIRPNANRNQLLGAEHVALEYNDPDLKDRLSSPEFSVQTVDLRGPQLAIDAIDPTGVIFRGQVPRMTKDATTVRVTLELLPIFKDVVTRPRTVFATYQVEPDWQDADFKNVPITIDDRLLADDVQGDALFQLQSDRVEMLKLKVKGELATRVKRLASDDAKRQWVRKHLRLVIYPEQSDLAQPLPKIPRIEFVLLDDFQPQKDKDFRVVGLSSVTLLLKNGGK